MLLRQLEQINHLLGPALFSVTLHQCFPDPVEARYTLSGLTPLLQWLRSRQGTRFSIQHVQVVFEIEDLLLTPVTAFMLRYAPPLVPQFDCAGVRFRLHLSASRQREGVHVGEHLGTTQSVHGRETRLR